MLRWARWASLVVSALGSIIPVACTGSEPPSSGPPDKGASPEVRLSPAERAALASVVETPSRDACPRAVPHGTMRCYARVQTNGSGNVVASATPYGLGPADLTEAYAVPSTGTRSGTIAIVDAFDHPDAESDLAVYRYQYGLPPCTTENGCFKKVNQNGLATPLPKGNGGWAAEIALDIDMASAICPACKILLLEAFSPTLRDLGIAVNTAVRMGALVVSNSYGGQEMGDETDGGVDDIEEAERLYYSNHPEVGIFAASGDWAYADGTSYPASGANVIGIGGTRLVRSPSSERGWLEVAWASAGSGCSRIVPKPSWANDGPDCAKKTVADISAVSDPATGVAVYNTFGGGEGAGWTVIGGTSAATPIVAAIFVLTGKASAGGAFIWNNTNLFFDITTGNNGSGPPDSGLLPCVAGPKGAYLCNARSGFDGPTGWGTPNTALILGTRYDAPDAGPVVRDAGTTTDASVRLDATTDTPPPAPPDAAVPASPNDAGSARSASTASEGGSGCAVALTASGDSKGRAGIGALFAMIGILAARRRRKLMR